MDTRNKDATAEQQEINRQKYTSFYQGYDDNATPTPASDQANTGTAGGLGPGAIGTSGDLLDFDFFGGSSQQERPKTMKEPEPAFDFGFGANSSSSTQPPANLNTSSIGPNPQDQTVLDMMEMLGPGGRPPSNSVTLGQSNPPPTGKKPPDFSKDAFQTRDASKYDMVNEMLNNFGSAATTAVNSGMNQAQ